MKRILLMALATLVTLALGNSPVFAADGEMYAKNAPAKKAKKGGTKKKSKSQITVPLDIGVGPAFNHFFGPVGDDQMFHYGIKLDVAAVINQQVIRDNLDKIPKKYRKMASNINELKYYPLWWLPDSLIISPKVENTGMYGITFRPIHLGIDLFSVGSLGLSVSVGAILTYAYIMSDKWVNSDSMHFLRPGADVRAELSMMFTDSVGISLGWASAFYVPQSVDQKDSSFWDVPGIDNSLWHNGQAFLMFHYRFPYSTTL